MTAKTHWDPTTQTTCWARLGHIWSHIFCGVISTHTSPSSTLSIQDGVVVMVTRGQRSKNPSPEKTGKEHWWLLECKWHKMPNIHLGRRFSLENTRWLHIITRPFMRIFQGKWEKMRTSWQQCQHKIKHLKLAQWNSEGQQQASLEGTG